MQLWELWLGMALESVAAALQTEASGQRRSAVNRFYYGAYQAVTAVVLFKGTLKPPMGRECWQHAITPRLIPAQFAPEVSEEGERAELAAKLRDLYTLRVIADYEGSQAITEANLAQVHSDAMRIVEAARTILPEERHNA